MNALDYFKSKLRSIEGVLVFAISLIYIFGFIFFEYLTAMVLSSGIKLDSMYRVVFLIMPLLLVVVLLWMDSTAKTLFERSLSVVVIIVAAFIPLLKLLWW